MILEARQILKEVTKQIYHKHSLKKNMPMYMFCALSFIIWLIGNTLVSVIIILEVCTVIVGRYCSMVGLPQQS